MDEFDEPEYEDLIVQFEEMLLGNQPRFFDMEELEIIADHYFQEGEEEKAMQAIDLGQRMYPEAPNFALMQARFYMDESRLQAAHRMIKRAEELDPKSKELVLVKADFYSVKGQPKKAIQLYLQALDFADEFGNRPEITTNLAMQYMANAQYKKAIPYFKEALQTFPDDEFLILNIKLCFDITFDFKGAVVFFEAFVDSNPYSEVGWYNLGLSFYSLGKLDEAFRAFDYALVIDEQFAAAYFEKGRILEEKEAYMAAIEVYEDGFEYFDSQGYPNYRIGVCHRLLNNKEAAKFCFQSALHVEPDMEEPHLELAALFLDEGDVKHAMVHIKKLLKLQPQNVDYHIIAADVFQQAGLHLEAEKHFRRAFKLGARQPELYISLAELLMEIDEVAEALEILSEGIQANPESDELLAVAAGYLLTLGERKKALEIFEKALLLNEHILDLLFDIFPHLINDPDLKKYKH